MAKKFILIILGIFISLILLEFGLRLAGFAISYYQQYKNNKVLKNKSQYTIMCLGESTTANQYPIQLQQILDEKYPNKFSIIDCGIPGTNLHTILSTLDSNVARYKPNIVICMLGINNGLMSKYIGNTKQNSEYVKSKKYLKIYNLFLLLKIHLQSLFKNKLLFANDNIKQVSSLADLANKYYSCAEYEKSIELSKKVLQIEPLNEKALYLLATIYFYHVVPKNEKESYKFATIAINNNCSLHRPSFYYIAISYCIKNNIPFQNLLEKLLNDNLKPEFIDNTLTLYRLIKPYLTEEQLNKFMNKILIKSDISYGFLAINSIEQKKYKKSQKYFYEAEQLRLNFPNMEVYNMYKLIIKKLINKDIKVICMQYPVRSILSLQEQLKNEFYYNKITFISNENIFKDALMNKIIVKYLQINSQEILDIVQI